MMRHDLDYDGNDRSRTNTGEFTKHAADHILRVYSSNLLHQAHDADRPLFNQIKSKSYNKIERLVKNTFPHCDIQKVRQVYAPQMYGMYLLHKEEFLKEHGDSGEEKLLYHVTTESRALESLNDGLDWRRTLRSKFGCGVSFSDNIDYANYHANRFSSEGDEKAADEQRPAMIALRAVGDQ